VDIGRTEHFPTLDAPGSGDSREYNAGPGKEDNAIIIGQQLDRRFNGGA
jgi:hypothetical protein